MTFTLFGTEQAAIRGSFRNLGIGAALNIRHGTGVLSGGNGFQSIADKSVGGVRDGESLGQPGDESSSYRPETTAVMRCNSLFCEYANRFGDRYRLIVPIRFEAVWKQHGPEKLYVRHGPPNTPNWVMVLSD
jgi:hypothetical protein